jgi:hypothetical protein
MPQGERVLRGTAETVNAGVRTTLLHLSPRRHLHKWAAGAPTTGQSRHLTRAHMATERLSQALPQIQVLQTLLGMAWQVKVLVLIRKPQA